MTLPLALAFQVVVGASFALTCRHSDVHQPLMRSVAVWALLSLQGLLMVPATAYGLWRYAAWGWQYLWEPPAMAWMWAGLCPLVALLGYGIARRGLLNRRLSVALGTLAVGVLAVTALLAVTHTRLEWVGTLSQFQAHSGELQPLWGSNAGYLVILSVPVQVVAWAFTLWRLYLLDRATVTSTSGPGQGGHGESVPQISAELLSVANPAGTRRTS